MLALVPTRYPYPIQDDDKHQLFVEEAIADGKEGDDAISTASLALNRLGIVGHRDDGTGKTGYEDE